MNELDDKRFIDAITARMPTVPVPDGLQTRLLADFDRIAARRPRRWAGLAELWADRLWPGAPLWQPASILALSLAIGLCAGAFVPAQSSSTTTVASVSDQTLLADSTPQLDYSRDL